MQENFFFNNSVTRLYETFDFDESEAKAILEYLVIELEDFQKCLSDASIETLQTRAHKVKGDLSIAGFLEVAEQVAAIETLILQGTYKSCDSKCINQTITLLLGEIEHWLKGSGASKKSSTGIKLHDLKAGFKDIKTK